MKIISTLILLLFLFTFFSSAQNDSVSVNDLNQPFQVPEYERVAYNSQETLANYSFDETEKIDQILTVWKSFFGDIEPILRVKILNDILHNKYQDSNHKEYIEDYIIKFTDRYYASIEDDYEETYRKEKGFFDYVPFNGSFDIWTANFADTLLKKQTKGSSEYLLCQLLSNNVDTFDYLLRTEKYRKNYIVKKFLQEYGNANNIFTVYAGYWHPLGKFRGYFNPSPHFGITLGYSIQESVRLDFAFHMGFLRHHEPFDINKDSVMITANGKLLMSFGMLLTKEFQIRKSLFIDGFTGLGITLLNTDLSYLYIDDDGYEYNRRYGVTAPDLSVGLNLRKRISGQSCLGINFSYHFVPFGIDNSLESNIGTNFTTVSLFFRY